MNKISVILPIYGGADRLGPLLSSLERQTCRPYEVLIVDNGTTASPPPALPPQVRYFHNTGNRTLSGNYNLGAAHADGDLLLMTQHDCWPADATTLEKLVSELNGDAVAATAPVKLPEEVFQTYSFWGKVLMARWVGTTRQGISGKFDLIRKDVFDRIGGYDCEHFLFAGEDMDLCVRLSRHGRVVVTAAEVIHHHHQDNETSAYYVWGKHYMNAEGFGVGLRRHGLQMSRVPYASRWTHHINKFLYPLLLLLPFWPVPTTLLLFVMTNLAQSQSFRAGTIRLPLLLLFNPFLFFTGLGGTMIGFVHGKQTFKP